MGFVGFVGKRALLEKRFGKVRKMAARPCGVVGRKCGEERM